jgi:hypothetical protein
VACIACIGRAKNDLGYKGVYIYIYTKVSSSPSLFSVACGSATWATGRCSSDQPVFLCVNCPSPCSTEESVPATAIQFQTPCSSPESFRYSTLFNYLQIDLVERSVAPAIVSIVTNSQRSSISAAVTVEQSSGSIVCSAYLSTLAYIPSDANLLLLTGSLIPLQSNMVTIDIPNLQPASQYDLFCSTFSPVGVSLTRSSVLATKSVVRTQCCRELMVNVIATTYSSGADTPVALTIDTGGIVPSDLTVELSVLSADKVVYPFVPSQLSITTTSRQTVSYVRQNQGLYYLVFVLSGQSAEDYSIVYSASVITVLGADEPPPAPQMTSATLANDGASIRIAFDSPTNRAGFTNNFLCAVMFMFRGIQSDTRCLWVDDATVSKGVYIYIYTKVNTYAQNAK